MSRKNPGPVYPNLKPWELEPHYARHISAMTSEGLHSKAAIAEQLAWRDQRIEALEAALHPTTEEVIARVAKACGQSGDMYIESAESWILNFFGLNQCAAPPPPPEDTTHHAHVGYKPKDSP